MTATECRRSALETKKSEILYFIYFIFLIVA